MATIKIDASCIFLTSPFDARVRDLIGAVEQAAKMNPPGSELPSPMELADHLARLMGQDKELPAVFNRGVAVLCRLVRSAYRASILVVPKDGRFFTKDAKTAAA